MCATQNGNFVIISCRAVYLNNCEPREGVVLTTSLPSQPHILISPMVPVYCGFLFSSAVNKQINRADDLDDKWSDREKMGICQTIMLLETGKFSPLTDHISGIISSLKIQEHSGSKFHLLSNPLTVAKTKPHPKPFFLSFGFCC